MKLCGWFSMKIKMSEILKDFPSGPLDFYRQKASFDWKKMKLFLYGEQAVRYMHIVYEELKCHQEFQPVNTPMTFDEERYLTFKQSTIIRANENKFDLNSKYRKFLYFSESAFYKYGLTIEMFSEVIRSMGSNRHNLFLEQIKEGKISGCFGLTEVGHGSNVKGMRTTATYDKSSKEFVIHTSDFQAAKCWIGGLGNTATHMLLFAQLHTGNKNYGLHNFVVPIRDPSTLLSYPGITVGDMGEKIGLNGLDNGFILFNNYRIPREYLLNKHGDVTEDGEYITPFDSDNKRFGASLLTLSVTRAGIVFANAKRGGHALTIAVRYAGVRKQFGHGDEEMHILEYQTHQYRLLPYLAAVYVLNVFAINLIEIYQDYVKNPGTAGDLDFLGIELHIITSAAKPVSGWSIREAVQSCREACGGHGYLKAAGLGYIKSNHDPAQTYEGESWVLIQQVDQFLVKVWENIFRGIQINSPLKSVDFLNDAISILQNKKFVPRTVDELCQVENILEIYQWLNCYLLRQTYERRSVLMKSGANKFSAKKDTQVFYGMKLGTAYIEHFFLQRFLEKITNCSDSSLHSVLLNMFCLYGLHSLEKFLSVLYQGGYASGEMPAILIQDGILEMCSRMKDDAVALVDAIAPPDFIVNSVLGASDGDVYRHLENSFFTSPYGTGRPKWWKDIVNWKNLASSKL